MSTMVMTGGTSGFGAIAAERLTRSGKARLILGARRTTPGGDSIPLDLTELDSVRAFAAAVRERLGQTPVDALVLNAGVIHPHVDGRTADGFESTFAVNHLAHHLLVRLLLPALRDGALVVLTTSGTYDPATRAGLTPPRHAEADLLAHPDRDPGLDPRPRKAGEHAYTASKLCAVLTALTLSRLPDRRLTALAYARARSSERAWPRTSRSRSGRPGRSSAHRRSVGPCADSTLTSTRVRRPETPWPTWSSASRCPRAARPSRPCARGSSPGRRYRSWRAGTGRRRPCGRTAEGWSDCRRGDGGVPAGRGCGGLTEPAGPGRAA